MVEVHFVNAMTYKALVEAVMGVRSYDEDVP
jgi:hypothetical protein